MEDKQNVPLAWTLILDWTAATTSAFLVAPFISIIDKAIFSNASGRQPLFKALTSGFTSFLKKPIHSLRQPAFYLIWGVYSGTYIIANSTESLCKHNDMEWFYPKFIATSTANVTLSVMKDKYFTRAFGKSVSTTISKVSMRSYGLYTMRDSLTIFSSFNLPSVLSLKLQTAGVPTNAADTFAQLATPCAVQLVSTPLHLMGMDIYNRVNATPNERLVFIKKEYLKTSLARMGRIFPAFGIGGVVNKSMRKNGTTKLEAYFQKSDSSKVDYI